MSSDLKAMAAEPDPSATSIPSDQTVNKDETKNAAEIRADTNPESVEIKSKELVPEPEDSAKPEKDEKQVVEPTSTGEKTDGSTKETAEKSTEANGEKKENGEKTDEDKSEPSRKRPHEDDGKKLFDRRRNNNREFRGNRPFQDYRKNVKSDLTSQEISSDPDEIRKQVEFYFSDSNLPMDKFLYGKVGGAENNPVPLEIIHSFKRMRHFQPFSAIVEALKTSTALDLVENDTAVKRKVALDIDYKGDKEVAAIFEDRAMARSVYVKGFGEETPSTTFDIEAFFQRFGSTNAIRLRRTDKKIFKGSVFVEFDSEETAKKFIELDPKPKFQDTKELLIKSKKQYCDEKIHDINTGKIKRNNDARDYKRRDNRDWRERRDEDAKKGFRDNRDRRGGHKGFGGRGRGGHKSHRGGFKGGDRDRRNEKPREEQDQHDPKVPTLQVTGDDNKKLEVKDKPVPTQSNGSTNDKKRPREEEAGNAADNRAIKKAAVEPTATT
ncbi:MAG: hypothetical protein M1834_007402 [Cirrosporium novae-zelandiae]|nr:MAG: hypothetical protein M1834_007402 [Cirrosporium novae-zelandiae]